MEGKLAEKVEKRDGKGAESGKLVHQKGGEGMLQQRWRRQREVDEGEVGRVSRKCCAIGVRLDLQILSCMTQLLEQVELHLIN